MQQTIYMQIAQEHGMSVTTLAAAWSKHWDFVASTIIGARTAEQLDESLKALDITLVMRLYKLVKKSSTRDNVSYGINYLLSFNIVEVI